MKFIHDGKMMVLGISKTAQNNGKRKRHFTKKTLRKLYFYDEYGKFTTKRISFGEAIFIRLTKRKVKVLHDK